MGDVSENFSRWEFACKCGCGFAAVDVELLGVLEQVRQIFGKVTITSGCRCAKHNKNEKGYPKSKHVHGQAADIVCQAPAGIIQDFLEEQFPDKYGLGKSPAFTHIDVRRKRARWRY